MNTQDQFNLDGTTLDKFANLVQQAGEVKQVEGTYHFVLPEGFKHVDVTAIVEKSFAEPERKKGRRELLSIESFIQYVKDQDKTGAGYIYADTNDTSLTAVFNDDKAGPGWRDHVAVFKPQKSPEFSGWIANNKKPLEQEEFALFLEDNIADVCEPSGEVLLQVALTLQAKTDVQFSSARRLDNGQVQFAFTETIDARAGANGSIEIPREFTLGLRLFKNGAGYKVRARLKYRLGGGKLKFWYELDRIDTTIENAFKDYIDLASKESGYTVLLGKA